MKETYKSLIFKDGRSKVLGRWAHPSKGGWLGGNIPLVMNKGASIKALKEIYPVLDFKNIKIVDIEIIIK